MIRTDNSPDNVHDQMRTEKMLNISTKFKWKLKPDEKLLHIQ